MTNSAKAVTAGPAGVLFLHQVVFKDFGQKLQEQLHCFESQQTLTMLFNLTCSSFVLANSILVAQNMLYPDSTYYSPYLDYVELLSSRVKGLLTPKKKA